MTRMKVRVFPRRTLLRTGLAGLAALMTPPLAGACSSEETSGSGGGSGSDGGAGSGGAAGSGGGNAGAAGSGGGAGGAPPSLRSHFDTLGELGDPDANGVRLAPGFTSRIVAQTDKPPVAGKPYVWHIFPDGGATFASDDGGFIYVSNSEVPFTGGVGALRFDANGELVDAYRILDGTSVNCAGGKTPWGTWLSCEEIPKGKVWECDPTGANPAVALPALGLFKHEAVAVDPVNHQLYLTEDEPDGRFYRFTPVGMNGNRPDLSAGKLEVAEVGQDGKVTWHELPDPGFGGTTPTREQVAASTAFSGGEGIAHHAGVIYFSTKGNNRVWAYEIATETLSVLYDAATAANPVLKGVDNITVSCCGDVLVAEDGDDMQIVAILPDGTLKPVVQVIGHDESEICGPAFDPSGTRLYFSSQRGAGAGGVTFEISGPFHSPA